MYAATAGQEEASRAEVITENVFERPADETIAFFPKQVLCDLFVSALLLACVALSYISPAPLTEPADTATIAAMLPKARVVLLYSLRADAHFFPGYALISLGRWWCRQCS